MGTQEQRTAAQAPGGLPGRACTCSPLASLLFLPPPGADALAPCVPPPPMFCRHPLYWPCQHPSYFRLPACQSMHSWLLFPRLCYPGTRRPSIPSPVPTLPRPPPPRKVGGDGFPRNTHSIRAARTWQGTIMREIKKRKRWVAMRLHTKRQREGSTHGMAQTRCTEAHSIRERRGRGCTRLFYSIWAARVWQGARSMWLEPDPCFLSYNATWHGMVWHEWAWGPISASQVIVCLCPPCQYPHLMALSPAPS